MASCVGAGTVGSMNGTNRQQYGDEAEALANVIRALRAGARMTQAELASASGISRATIVNIESGRHVVSTWHLAQIGGVFDVPGSEILRRAGY